MKIQRKRSNLNGCIIGFHPETGNLEPDGQDEFQVGIHGVPDNVLDEIVSFKINSHVFSVITSNCVEHLQRCISILRGR